MAIYYVSYSIIHGGRIGFGSCTVDVPVQSYKDVTAIRERLEKDAGIPPQSIVILSWMPLPLGEG